MTVITQRKKSGQSMVVLGAIITLLILSAVGLFSYEVNRLEICRSQLRAACEAAALAAAATLASQDNLDPSQGQTEAIQTALDSFQKNSVAGVSLSSAILSGTKTDNPSQEKSSLFIEFLDPNNNNQPVNLGNPAGKIVRVVGAFGLKPSFGNFLGLPIVPLRADSLGGVPDLDVVLCFDVSGSIDDQTPITCVRRQWNGTTATGTIQYIVPPTSSGCPAGSTAKGRIYDLFGPPATGTTLQAVAPQNLADVNRSDHRWRLNFSEAGTAKGLRGANNAGSPPGNYPGLTSGTGNSQTITDIVVNIDGKTTFAGLNTADGFSFPNVATLVEASRGNLENQTVFSNSRANKGVPSSVLPKAGYQAKYNALAMKNTHPISDAQIAAAEFFTIMNTNTIGHFGLICFSDNAGTATTTTISGANVDETYNPGGQGKFPNPAIALNPAIGATNYSTIQGTLPTLVATGGTNIGDVLSAAIDQLRNKARPGAKKAIVLFTDGMPTVGNPLHSDPWTNARKAASKAKQYGIPIYAIGLAQNPEIVPLETSILNDTNSNPNSGGVCGIAGNGGKFFLVTDVNDLRKTFENIARQLVQLVHS